MFLCPCGGSSILLLGALLSLHKAQPADILSVTRVGDIVWTNSVVWACLHVVCLSLRLRIRPGLGATAAYPWLVEQVSVIVKLKSFLLFSAEARS